MKICEKLKSIFQSSSNNNKETKIPEVEFTFGDMTGKDIATLNVNDFKNKCENETEKLIKNISSMSQDECKNKDAYFSKILKEIRDVQKILRGFGDVPKKYQLFYSCLKRYQNEIRKRMDRSE